MYLYEPHGCMVPVEVLCALPILNAVALHFSLLPHTFYRRKRKLTPNQDRCMQQKCHINYFVTRKQPKISIQLSKSTRWCFVLIIGVENAALFKSIQMGFPQMTRKYSGKQGLRIIHQAADLEQLS